MIRVTRSRWREMHQGEIIANSWYQTWGAEFDLAYETVDKIGPTGVAYKEGRNFIHLHFQEPCQETLFRQKYSEFIET